MKNIIFIVLALQVVVYTQNVEPDSSNIISDSDTAKVIYQVDKQDINRLPIRDMPGNLKTMPDVELEQNQLVIRGGNSFENQTMINGAYIFSPYLYKNGLHIIPSALETVVINPGNYNAAYGWGISALINNRLRTGRPDFHASIEFETDKMVKQGENFLSTTSFGDHFLTLILDGRLYDENNRFFLAYENEDIGDTQKMFNDGFNLKNRVDWNPLNPIAGQDTVDVVFPAGYTPKNWLNRHSINARLDFNYDPIIFSVTGLYTHVEDYQLLTTAQDVFNNREQPHIGDIFYGSGEITWKINNKNHLKLQSGYLYETHERSDDYFGTNWRLWSDSAAIAQHTNNDVIYRSYSCPPYPYLLNGFYFQRNGTLNYDYTLDKHRIITGRIDYQSLINDMHNLNIGVEANYRISRMYAVNPSEYMELVYFFGNEHLIPEYYNQSAYRTRGFDYFGNESDEIEEPIKNLFGAFYISDNVRYDKWQIDLGLRLDFLKRLNKDLYLVDPYYPKLEKKGYDSLVKLNPRINLSYNISNHFSIITSYNMLVQPPNYLGSGNYDYDYNNQLEISVNSNYPDIGYGTIALFSKKMKLNKKYKEADDLYGFTISLNSFRKSRIKASLNYTYMFWDKPFVQYPIYISNIHIPDGYPDGYDDNIGYTNLRNHAVNLLADYCFSQNDGGKIFSNSGLSVMVNFASGIEYHIYEHGVGQVRPSGYDYMVDPRSRLAIPVQTSFYTPWISTVDLKLNKTFTFSSYLKSTFYIRVINLFNKQNTLYVYPSSGKADDDGFLSSPEAEHYIQYYGGQQYIDMYRAVNLQGGRGYWSQTGIHLYGNPRQIMFGIKIEY
ncbi:MAG: TonB-dependent receptor [Calditrichaceae bacterium]|nr:TonB-dependent receptor [Calditrichaceae bacterium]MBN2709629.1 TonB-dependent receptor [Calditrichaceae bacterium]RQV92425.1 MAG: TonB-dependent receptor [Calditrichota bacterium]